MATILRGKGDHEMHGELPVDHLIPDLRAALAERRSAVLTAEPGAGKTTRVPPALLNEEWLNGKRILMLEPRRLAARSAASYMASQMGEKAGQTVGYRVKMDTKTGPQTRIEVVTEGVLIRLLQEDPSLDAYGLVIFDEFHERRLEADLGLALCLQSRSLFRPELRLLLMSATLQAEPAAALLGGAACIHSPGRAYPVDTRYCGRPSEGEMLQAVVRMIMTALDEEDGDLLVFLPGEGEIRRVRERLSPLLDDSAIHIAPLYGRLPLEQQDEAIAPGRVGTRKVVLATSIAETSLTVEGIRVVIDSGLSRVSRFSSRTGMTRLETLPVSKASADQRRGRAGRTMPGVCYRLWSERDEMRLDPQTPPEIRDADLAPLALTLAEWGVHSPEELQWLDPPPAPAYRQALELLRQLDAVTPEGAITRHGRQMAELGLHPRLAHMVLMACDAGKAGKGGQACELAVLLQERDVLRMDRGRQASGMGVRAGGKGLGEGGRTDGAWHGSEPDIRLRYEALQSVKPNESSRPTFDLQGVAIDTALCRRILAESAQLKRQLRLPHEANADPDDCGRLLAYAYPDRIAQRRADGRFLLSGGRGAVFPSARLLAGEEWLVAVELADSGRDSRIHLAAPVALAEVREVFRGSIEEVRTIAWDPATQSVKARVSECLGALTISDRPLVRPDRNAVTEAMLEGIAQEGLSILPWRKASVQFRQRMRFMRRLEPDWPDVSDEGLTAALPDWLGPWLAGIASRSGLEQLNLLSVLEGMLSWEQRRQLEEWAPAYWTVPSGTRAAIQYEDPEAPVLAVRLQELFGLTETPHIGGGQVPLVLHLLSPARRPVQVTRDLASFWRDAYFEVRKDLKGRYPKHYWPDDPLNATPTSRTRPSSK